jgi:hypothetical protein
MDSGTDLLSKLQQARSLLGECIATLGDGPSRKGKRPTSTSPGESHAAPHLDFDTNGRAFVKAHARGLSGPKKFTLLLAFLSKGKPGVEVELSAVEKHWNRMTAPNLLDGKFNRFYSSTAKENGWVNTKKKGLYFLRPSWRQIFT